MFNDVLLAQDIWPKIATPEQIAALLKDMQEEQQHMERLVQEGCAVLPLLEGQVVDAACSDPGAALLPHLILPMLGQHIESRLVSLNVSVCLCVSVTVSVCECDVQQHSQATPA